MKKARVRAAAEVIDRIGRFYGWFKGPPYSELEKKDPIGFEEFNSIIEDALAAADLAADEEAS